MTHNNQPQHCMEEDEIDLRELFYTIKKNKTTVILITAIVTALALIYVTLKTPIYEATAMVEIGNYKANNDDGVAKVQLDDAEQLAKKLDYIYVDMQKHNDKKDAEIVSISSQKGSNVFVEISAEATSNAKAIEQINQVVAYIQESHKKILDEVKTRREYQIENINRSIKNITDQQMKLLDAEIVLIESKILEDEKSLKVLNKNLKRLKSKNPVLASLELKEKRDLSGSILELKMKLLAIKNTKAQLATNKIINLQEKKALLVAMLEPYNYKNSTIVGSVITQDTPSKPKRGLVVVVAFITGLILSIFFVFFLEFLRGMREDEEK